MARLYFSKFYYMLEHINSSFILHSSAVNFITTKTKQTLSVSNVIYLLPMP